MVTLDFELGESYPGDMAQTAKLSSKGQLTVPVWAREKLGIGPGSRIAIRIEGDKIILERIDKSIAALRGSLKGVYGDVGAYIRESRRDRPVP